MHFSLHFLEHDVSVAEDTWTALETTGSDVTLASIRATIQGVLERGGSFLVEGSDGQIVRHIATPAEFEGYMQEVDIQRSQLDQDQT